MDMHFGFNIRPMVLGGIVSAIVVMLTAILINTHSALAVGGINWEIDSSNGLHVTVAWNDPTTVEINGSTKNLTVIVNGTPVVTPIASSNQDRLWGSCNGRNAVLQDDKTIVLLPADAAAIDRDSEWATCDLQPSSRGATVYLDGKSYDVAPGKEFILSVPTSVLVPLSFTATMK